MVGQPTYLEVVTRSFGSKIRMSVTKGQIKVKFAHLHSTQIRKDPPIL